MKELTKETLLQVKNLNVVFGSNKKKVKVITDLTFDIKKGTSVGIVGESGSGKSVTSLSIMGLLPKETTSISGEIVFLGNDLMQMNKAEVQNIRGKDISMIFQEPMTSLNPLHTIGKQIMEPLLVHQKGLTSKQRKERAIELLNLTGIPDPENRFHDYPHQMSGGMRQRVMIAMALACNPKLLIADEPTTALDVTIQAQILELLKDLKQKLDMSVMLITHDLGIVSEICSSVIVMYTGQIVEHSSIDDIFENPLHPYTRGLLNAIPKKEKHKSKLFTIEGSVPNPGEMPIGCNFAPRCDKCFDRCLKEKPELTTLPDGRKVRCFIY